LVIAIGVAFATTKHQVMMAMTPEEFMASNLGGSVKATPSGLQYQVLEEGSGAKPGPNDLVLVQYEGKLLNGKVFDTTKTDGKARPIPVSGTIPGWAEGMQLMSKGAKYRFWMPPTLGYGAEGAGNGIIPPNAVLVFDVELVDVAAQPMGMGMGGMPQGHGGM
jgi:FKBP-type peptidyl-prolyl cis-trans isomerase